MSERGEKQKSCEVLVIDDEPSVAYALKMILEDTGYRVAVALTGRDGIEQSRHGRFCLTITDFRLPDMTGLDVINAVRRDDPRSLFIIITSHGSEELMAEARSRGASGFLLKPFPPSEILRLVENTLADPRPSDEGARPSDSR
ncbi:MAG TPA: response regulator [Pyrinomonadaceae bacterium]|nr:response regulator [Pyrinomonadaceae bacterium]